MNRSSKYRILKMTFDFWSPVFCTACPAGRFGQRCQMECVCENNSHCDPVSGRCSCAPGWTGPHCSKGTSLEQQEVSPMKSFLFTSLTGAVAVCDAGHWGADCAETCDCSNADLSCDAVTGQCSCEAGFTGTHCKQSEICVFNGAIND